MNPIIVTNKSELKKAIENNEKHIVLRGKIAEDVERSLSISKYSVLAITTLGAALALTPFTGGLSAVAAVPVATMTGIEVALIIAVAFLGLALVLNIVKDYKRVEFKGKSGEHEAELVLEKK